MSPDVLSLLAFWLQSKKSPNNIRPVSWKHGLWAITARFGALTFDPGCELVFERLHHEFL